MWCLLCLLRQVPLVMNSFVIVVMIVMFVIMIEKINK